MPVEMLLGRSGRHHLVKLQDNIADIGLTPGNNE